MSATSVEILNWKPITTLDRCLPYRVHFGDWSFKLDKMQFTPNFNDKEFLSVNHGPEFQGWLEDYNIAGYQVVFWGDNRYRWEAANDEVHTIWSFCFEREKDAILFKLKWV